MRVHVLSGRADSFGGGNVYTRQFVEALTREGVEVTLICTAPGDPPPDVRHIAIVPKGNYLQVPALWRADDLLSFLQHRHDVRRLDLETPDIVVDMIATVGYWHHRRFPRVPRVYCPHSLVTPVEFFDNQPKGSIDAQITLRLWRHVERRALQRSAATVRFTEFAGRAMTDYYAPENIRRIAVLPAPVPVPPGPLLARTGQQPLRLLSVGRLVATKNVAFTIAALHRQQSQADWTLDVVGTGEEQPALEAQVHRLGLDGRVRFRGHQMDMAAVYREADLLVFPSKLESAGLVLLEAAGHGVPTIVVGPTAEGYRSASPELIVDGVTGFVARDETDFVRRLTEILDNPARLAAAGRAAREKVLADHTWKRHVGLWLDLFADILAHHTAPAGN